MEGEMGSDIHLRLEVMRDGAWTGVPIERPDWRENGDTRPDPEGRNYSVFALLADVRNGSGFAGCKIFDPIEAPLAWRGLPDGVDPEGSPWLGEHSFTWATVAELKALDWDMVFHEYGVLSALEYNEWLASGDTAPQSWSGDVDGPGVRKISAESLRADRAPDDRNLYIRAEWDRRAVAESGFRRWLDTLTEEQLGVPLDRARVLMGFDS
jgi:hypothetical protein